MSPMETKDLVRLLAHVKGPGKLKGKRAHFSASTLPTSWTQILCGRVAAQSMAWCSAASLASVFSPSHDNQSVSKHGQVCGSWGGAVETPELRTPTSDFF